MVSFASGIVAFGPPQVKVVGESGPRVMHRIGVLSTYRLMCVVSITCMISRDAKLRELPEYVFFKILLSMSKHERVASQCFQLHHLKTAAK
jgi:hypothetical protein